MRLRLPTYKQGYAKNPEESFYPEDWQGLIGAWCPFLGPTGLTLFDHSGYKNHGSLVNMSPGSAYLISADSHRAGYALEFDGSDDKVDVPDSPIWDASDDISISCWLNYDTKALNEAFLCRWDESSNQRVWSIAFQDDSVGNIRFDTSSSGGFEGQNNVASTSGTAAGSWYHILCCHNSVDRTNKIYLNGSLEATTSSTEIALHNSDIGVFIGYSPQFGGSEKLLDGRLDDVRIYNRALTDRQVQQIYLRGRAGIYQTIPRVYGSGGGGVTTSVPVASLTLTGQVPIVATTGNVDIAVPSTSLSIVGFAPTVDNPYNIDVPLGTLTLAGLAPTVDLTDNVDLPIPVASLTLTGLAPTVDNPYSIDVPAAFLTLSGQAPTVNLTGDQAIAVPLASLSLVGLAPAVDNPLGIDIPTSSITLTGQVPVVDIGANVTIQIPLATLTLTGLVPTVDITANVDIAIPSASLTLTGLTPTIVLAVDVDIAIPAASLTLTGLAPTVIGVGALVYAANKPITFETGGLIIQLGPVTKPIWSTSGRPSSPALGEYGFNITSQKEEIWTGSAWVNVDGS